MLRTRSIVALVNQFDELAKRLLPYGTESLGPGEAGTIAAHSAIWQAFELRRGVIYEPTPPLHRLLEDTYIADDVPIGAVQFPARTLCIVPEPSSWGNGEKSDATVFFRGAQTLACVTWGMHGERGQQRGVVEVVELPLDKPDRPIGTLLDKVCGSSESGLCGFWESAVKLPIPATWPKAWRESAVVNTRRGVQRRYDAVSQTHLSLRSPYFVSFDFLKAGVKVDGLSYPVVKNDWA